MTSRVTRCRPCAAASSPDNAAATSGELFAFIDGVDAIEDERLRSLFTKYVNQVTLASSKTEQLEDYYWQREDDI